MGNMYGTALQRRAVSLRIAGGRGVMEDRIWERWPGGKMFWERSVPSHITRDRGLMSTQEFGNRGLIVRVNEKKNLTLWL